MTERFRYIGPASTVDGPGIHLVMDLQTKERHWVHGGRDAALKFAAEKNKEAGA